MRCDIAEALLSAGAGPRLASKNGIVPLRYAVSCGNIDAIDMLLLSSAPGTTNQRNLNGWRALGYASSNDRPRAVSHVLAAGARIQRFLPFPLDVLRARRSWRRARGEYAQSIDNMDGASGISFPHSALSIAVFVGHSRIPQHVLEKDGEHKKTVWARTNDVDTFATLLHFAAGYSVLSPARAFLAAGALET